MLDHSYNSTASAIGGSPFGHSLVPAIRLFFSVRNVKAPTARANRRGLAQQPKFIMCVRDIWVFVRLKGWIKHGYSRQ